LADDDGDDDDDDESQTWVCGTCTFEHAGDQQKYLACTICATKR
jgi:hypothetical protein|tara:strand:+ start:375 stop:506 length:132 start_codon:yes stop_codon:yes gene_type:complete